MSRESWDLPEPVTFASETSPQKVRRRNISVTRIVALVVIVASLAVLAAGIENLPERIQDAASRRAELNRLAQLADRHVARGEYDQAVVAYDQLIEKIPNDHRLFHMRATLHYLRKDYTKATEDYSRVIELNPTLAVAYNNRAYMRALGRMAIEEALGDVDRALEIEPDAPSYRDTKAYLYYLLSRHDEALVLFNDLLNDQRTFDYEREGVGEIIFHRGLVLEALGRQEEAERDYARARQFGYQIVDYPRPLAADPDES